MDFTDEVTDDIANAVAHSLKQLFPDNIEIKLRGQCTDSGGGGTLHCLAWALMQRNLVHPQYIIVSRSLHNIQTCLRNAVTHVLGEGRTEDDESFTMNVMQLLHGAYNIQNWQEIDELKDLWKYFDDLEDEDAMKFQKLEKPILTR